MPNDLESLNALIRAAVEDTSQWETAAYYPTGDARIDRILSAVAVAGKEFRDTKEWYQKAGAPPHLRGETPIDWIQNAADDAATNCTPLPAEYRPVGYVGYAFTVTDDLSETEGTP